MKNNSEILVGKIVAPQGVRGDVRVHTYTASPTDLRTMRVHSKMFTHDAFNFIRRLNPTSDVIIAHINGFDDRNSVEQLRGIEMFINRTELPQTKSDEYYQTDLIGMSVVRDGIKIGTVVCFQNFGAGDIIELDNGDMVSFIGATVDMNNKTIIVK